MSASEKRLLRWIACTVLGALAWVGGCSDNPSGPDCPDPPCPAFDAVIVSDTALASSQAAGTGALAITNGAADDVVYVSMRPGTAPNGVRAQVRRVGDAAVLSVPVFDGGFDPVPVVAQAGDSIAVAVVDADDGTVLAVRAAVRPRRPPIVVRTDPPPDKTDVPVNASIVIVFSEPMDGASLTPTSVRLLAGQTAVSGTVRFLDPTLDATHVRVEFVPDAQLTAGTRHELQVTSQVQDLDGDALAVVRSVTFTTGTAVVGPPAEILLSVDTSLIMPRGVTQQLTASVRDATGNLLTDQPVTWSSNASTVVNVSATGLLTAVNEGFAGIVASVGTVSAGVSIRVLVTPASVTIAPASVTVAAGDTIQLTATPRDAAGQEILYPELTWTSSSPSTATVTAAGSLEQSKLGVVIGAAPGPVTITAASGPVSGSAAITVGPPVPVASVTVSPASGTLVVQGSIELTATLRDASGRVVVGRVITWTSDNNAVATVSASGLVTGVAVGGATVTATSEGVAGTAAINVITVTFASVSAGGAITAGLTPGGQAIWWGSDARSLAPLVLPGGLSFGMVSAGGDHACGVTLAGAAYCWGANDVGQLGNGNSGQPGPISTPVVVLGGLTFSSVSAGHSHTCGVAAGGTAYCWGTNFAGQLGGGGGTIPGAVVGGLSFAAISAGWEHSCGLDTTGAAYCWGANYAGQLGDGSTNSSSVPVRVAGGHTFSTVSAGYSGHTCGVTTAGAAYCWGQSALGTGSANHSSVPAPVAGGLAFTTVSAGGGHSCGAASGGMGFCWGESNSNGQLGNGSTSPALAPVAVSGTLSFASISAGSRHTCAVTSAGLAYCWGNNGDGQLGTGTRTGSAVPIKVAGQP